MTTSELDFVWAGHLELRPRLGTKEHAEGFKGAFVNVLVRCNSAQEYVDAVTHHVGEEGFDIVAIEDLAPLSAGRFELNEMMSNLAKKTVDYPVQWTTFHLYRDDDKPVRVQ